MPTDQLPKPSSRRHSKLKPLAIAAVLAITAGTFGLSSWDDATAADAAVNNALIQVTAEQSSSTAGALGIAAPGFSKIVAAHGGAVVNITIKRKMADDDAETQARFPFDPDNLPEFFRRVFLRWQSSSDFVWIL